jgi:hypothetical protein
MFWIRYILPPWIWPGLSAKTGDKLKVAIARIENPVAIAANLERLFIVIFLS